jgi:hypothetical protein
MYQTYQKPENTGFSGESGYDASWLRYHNHESREAPPLLGYEAYE